MLDFWDKKFSELAETYLLYRTKYISYIEVSLSEHPAFFSKYPIIFSYTSSVDAYRIESGLVGDSDSVVILSYLRERRERDILSGHTHIGPHRDDWGFSILQYQDTQNSTPESSIPAETYLSR